MPVRIGVAGLSGRMGRLLAEEIAAAGCPLSGGIGRGETLDALAAASDVVIDFTRASTVQGHAEALAAAGVAWVLGTSGLSAGDESAVAAAAAHIPVVYAANFSPGVTLVLALAEQMAASLPPDRYDAEILEMHHRQKVDAPSGTAVALGRAVAAGRGVDLADVMQSGRDGHTGPRAPGAIGFAALRGGQVVGEHSLLFAGSDEQIVLTHRAFDRRTFASGAVRAALWAAGRSPGLYGMRDVLGLAS
ncbi:4-hydroxy-tetrahydrodipicolinate reductase [Acidisoma sp.]|uniref:4-hydroxy-tetrahydrodipicolinate reductase n=1 Tax=Acidisoma sp. TaxID=1872115 RepID=UPI003B00CE10